MLIIIMVYPSVQLLTIFAKSSLLDVLLGSNYTTVRDVVDKKSCNMTESI